MFFSSFGIPKNSISVDLHSHLLPGIDDGVKSIDESLIIIRRFQELGYKKLITTPHIMSHMYPNTKEIILKQRDLVQNYMDKENINITLEASAEYYLDNDFLEKIKVKNLLPFHNKYILFETSYQSEPIILTEAIFQMQSKGYIPVLAHPERYLYMHHDIDKYYKLKELGILFQINVKSLKNTSSPITKIALTLINKGLVDFVGSDIHRINDIITFEKLLRNKSYKNILKKNTILNNSLN